LKLCAIIMWSRTVTLYIGSFLLRNGVGGHFSSVLEK